MFLKPLLRLRVVTPAVTALAVGSIILFPRTTIHAETADRSHDKKPIYDDDEVNPSSPSIPRTSPLLASAPTATLKSASPTPTERLAAQIGKSRMFIYAHVAAVETRVNLMMDSFLHLENSFTSTIASLAPPHESGEKLMPGSVYVLVAAMTGSIISRNRNILIRGVVPFAVGIGAGWVVLPITMRNISELLWKYEEKFPVIADGHLRTRKSLQRAWEMTTVHSQAARTFMEEKLGEGREAVEGWVRKGK